jgi:hypothetical protein
MALVRKQHDLDNLGMDDETMPWPTFSLLFVGPASTYLLARFVIRRAIARFDKAQNIYEGIRCV